tara:strand:- start:239 stop:586 length:348 start_codon:yes stop_codon:yes gene_type:complete
MEMDKEIHSYFTSASSGLVYDNILEYRVIVGRENTLPDIYCFSNIDNAKNYFKNLEKCTYSDIVALVEQNGYYLEDANGKIIDKNTGKKYKYINHSRKCEFPLNNLYYKPLFEMT